MDKQFLLVEEGSLDQNNMLKFLQNSGMTDANVIRYKQGTTKPELVSIESNDDVVEEIEKRTTNKILDALAMFLDDRTERHMETSTDLFAMNEKFINKLIFRGTFDEFMKQFEEYLTKFMKDDNN